MILSRRHITLLQRPTVKMPNQPTPQPDLPDILTRQAPLQFFVPLIKYFFLLCCNHSHLLQGIGIYDKLPSHKIISTSDKLEGWLSSMNTVWIELLVELVSFFSALMTWYLILSYTRNLLHQLFLRSITFYADQTASLLHFRSGSVK